MHDIYPKEMIYPVLHDKYKLKKFEGYVLLHGEHPSEATYMHPSQAFILALCDGKMAKPDIEYIFAETYQVDSVEAKRQVDVVFSKLKASVYLSDVALAIPNKYNPVDFLFKGNGISLTEFPDDRLPAPCGVNLTVTFACNFRCGYCYQNVTGHQSQRLDFDKCMNIIEESAEWGVVFFGLTGGEPTLFEGWEALVEAICARGMTPVFTSNGVTIGSDPSIASRLYTYGLRHITISLDASTADLHHAVSRTQRTFDKVVAAISALVAAGVRVTIKSVLTPWNADDMPALIDLAASLGVTEIGVTAMEGGAQGAPANGAPVLSAEDLERVRGAVLAKAEQHRGRLIVHAPRPAACTWQDGGWYPCGGLNMGMSIFPDGDITICDKLHGVKAFTYGNVFSQTLREAWLSESMSNLRNSCADKSNIDEECAQCDKLDVCRTGCFVDSYNAGGGYLGKMPHCHGPFLADA